jgi:putative ABC transport system permease protein
MKNNAPPKLFLNFFRWFCHPKLRDSIEGDLIELYEEQVKEKGKRQADIKFIIDVLLLFRIELIKSFKINFTPNKIAMLQHNLLLTFRNFKKFKGSFFINLIGLSTGLACTLAIYLWVTDEIQMNKFHEKEATLYQVLENVEQGTGMITRQSTSGPTAKALADEMPEVEYAVTTTYENTNTLSIDDKNFISAKGMNVSADFFKLFTYPIIQGDQSAILPDKKAIAISEDLATRLFGSPENVIGKVIKLQRGEDYHVTGVFKDVPKNSSAQFEFVLSFEDFWDKNEWVTNWFNTMPRTYLLLKPGTDIAQFNAKIKDIVRTKTENKATHRTPFVAKYSDRYLYNNYENGVQSGGRIEYVKLFSIVAVFILLIACINFMNLSTARASRRNKEVGIKKAIGAQRQSLVFQHLSESLLMTFLALATGLIMVQLFLPQFNIITQKQLTLDFNLGFVLSILCITLVTGLVAGSYPAIYLSGFNTIALLKGKLNNLLGEVWARKGLVTFQFVLSVILIVSVLVVYKQIEYTQTKNRGYNKDNIIVFGATGKVAESKETFIEEVKRIPGVKSASNIGHNLAGHNGGTYGVEWPGKDPNDRTEFERVPVNYGLIEMLDVEMIAGRTFSKDFAADTSNIIFNEAAIKFMGLNDPLGQTIKLWGSDRKIVGIAKDFNFESFREEIKPLFFFLNTDGAWNIMVKIEGGKEQEVIARVQQFYQEFNPGFTFDYRFLDEDYQSLYTPEQRVATLSKYFAGIAILISCLGLFGLAAFTAEKRTKEIGIRKILGASGFKIVSLLAKDFTIIVLASLFISLPASYFIAKTWLDGFAFSIELEWWYFVGAGLAALLIAWLTISFQTIKASQTNPVNSLRTE